jgi:hypothetical protein
MQVRLHKNSRTTLAIRQEIRSSPLSAYALANKYGITWETANKWKKAKLLEDKSSRPHKPNTSLTPQQEDLICFERKQFKKTIEDIFFSLEGEILKSLPYEDLSCLKKIQPWYLAS